MFTFNNRFFFNARSGNRTVATNIQIIPSGHSFPFQRFIRNSQKYFPSKHISSATSSPNGASQPIMSSQFVNNLLQQFGHSFLFSISSGVILLLPHLRPFHFSIRKTFHKGFSFLYSHYQFHKESRNKTIVRAYLQLYDNTLF